MLFKNISNFNNVNDYLPILNGSLNADLIIIFLVFHNIINSTNLKDWYTTFRLSAAIADILILVIGIIIARFLYKYLFSEFSIWKFTALAVAIQIIHDFVFYWFFSVVPRGVNFMLDFFKDYATKVGINAIIGDSSMMILACLLSSNFATYSININIICLIVSLYLLPYMLYYKK